MTAPIPIMAPSPISADETIAPGEMVTSLPIFVGVDFVDEMTALSRMAVFLPIETEFRSPAP
jgi:hypothetical protein